MKIENNFKIILMALCFMIAMPITAQDDNKEKRKEVDKGTKPFAADYFLKSKNSFFVLTANVVDGKILLDERATIKKVGGKLPYQRGNFKVSVLDSLGKSIGDYFMPDPLEARSCDGEGNNLSIVDSGLVHIPLPNSLVMSQLIFSRGKERISTLNVSTLVADLRKRTNKEN